ncbi:MAG: precorrin-6y C5,15-methyltransferase (decarboxylating) subunit CbiE [Nitrospinota bacterium]
MSRMVDVVGVGMEGPASLAPPALERVRRAEILIGGGRHLALFPGVGGERVAIRNNLKEVVELIRSNYQKKNIVVLASGDPNFYGIGHYLCLKLPREWLRFTPNVSSMQLAFARIRQSWQDAALLSVHARPIEAVVDAARRSAKVGLFTDDEHTPARVGEALLAAGIRNYRAYVCEELGGKGERVTEMPLEELPAFQCSPLNVLILLREGERAPSPADWTLGIDEEEFLHRKPELGLITKKEVRVLSLARMNLREESVVWDVGAASASVAIEAARIAHRGTVYAIEKNEEDVGYARANVAKFGAHNVRLFHGRAPGGCRNWPEADAIFIGGSGGELPELIALCRKKLKPGGRIVANVATIENLAASVKLLQEQGLAVEVTQVNVARSKPILKMSRFEPLPTVFIVTAWEGEGGAAEEEGE